MAAFALIPALGAVAVAGSVFAASKPTATTSSTHSSKHTNMSMSHDNTQFATDLASVLGLSATDVKARLDAGTKPADIITSAGKTESDVMTQMTALRDTAMKTKLQSEVLAGKITQTQANEMLSNMKNHRGGPHGHMFGINASTTQQ